MFKKNLATPKFSEIEFPREIWDEHDDEMLAICKIENNNKLLTKVIDYFKAGELGLAEVAAGFLYDRLNGFSFLTLDLKKVMELLKLDLRNLN